MNERFQDPGKAMPSTLADIMLSDEVDSPPSPPANLATQQRMGTALLLFLATCVSTFFVGTFNAYTAGDYGLTEALQRGFLYAFSLMTILVFHEMGHFLQSRRYGVAATWPYFLPFLPPIGTMGAVIFMEPQMGHRRALFDIGITGPLAGLVPTIICCIVGIHLSNYRPSTPFSLEPVRSVNFPLLFIWLFELFGKEIPPGFSPVLHPIAFAGWVGLFITSLNLIPIGQLDGGHILYTLLKKNARFVSAILLIAAFAFVVRFQLWGWSLMLIILLMMGPKHPPTANDDEPLGVIRYILGWLTLAFIVIGFTPQPFSPN
jgi:membrane-associated protease RseP (regulator of RpoE activity)